MENIDPKRRLNFISGADFYYFTYEILILLDVLTSKSGAFRDHRKLTYLIQLCGSEDAISILERNQAKNIQNSVDRELLFSTFASGELHKREIYKLLLALERKGFLELSRSQIPEVLDISLIRNAIPASFLTNDYFLQDRTHASKMKKLVPRLSTLAVETFLTKTYLDHGVKIWVH